MKKIKRAVDSLLNKYGYYKSDMPAGSALAEKDILELFRSYGDNKEFQTLLRDLCASDVRTYFQASSDEDRRLIRGAYQRTNYFISLIRKANDKRK